MTGLGTWWERIKDRNDSDLVNILKGLRADTAAPTKCKQKANYMIKMRPDLEYEEGRVVVHADETTCNRELPYHVQVAKKLIQLHKSAMSRNKEFNLELKDVHSLLQQKECFYTGRAFEKVGEFKRTIDRVDNSKGYVKGNVVACTEAANQLKEHLFERPTSNLDVNIEFVANVANKVLEVCKD